MDVQRDKTRQAVSAAVIGNVLEWYDFALYGYVAVILARKFFPPGDERLLLLDLLGFDSDHFGQSRVFIGGQFGQSDAVGRKTVEKLLRHIPRRMRLHDSAG